MAHRTLDPIPKHHDVDYVMCFDALARVQVAIRRRGPSAHLLLRRAMLEMAIGNYNSALDAARDAVAAAPRDPEGHYQEGLAWLWLARAQVGAAPLGPGAALPTQRPLRSLVQNAHEAFCSAMACAGQDSDAEAASAYAENLLALDDGHLPRAIRGEA